MSDKPLRISEEAAIRMPMKTVASFTALVEIGTWANLGAVPYTNLMLPTR